MNKSFFLYIHDDLSGDADWKKCGIGMTPYTVVRTRQKFCSKKFGLTHLYFGNPNHIKFLETQFKTKFYTKSGTAINGISAQTELFKMTELEIIVAINNIIKNNKLHVRKLELEEPYSAANSGECPYDIPGEATSYYYLKNKVKKQWGEFSEELVSTATAQFNELFKVVE
jgi:hypothetical protein